MKHRIRANHAITEGEVMRVCFTGPAIDEKGATILRADLIDACKVCNHDVHSTVRQDTEVLVASRTDTTKARAAARRGVAVIGYPEFIRFALSGTTVQNSGRVNLYTDFAKSIAKYLLVPEFGPTSQLALVDQL
jgi:hypothetical protein